MLSVLQDDFEDLLATGYYAVHHVFPGIRNRKKCEKYGFVVALRPAEHDRIHRTNSREWKAAAEWYWLDNIGTEGEFIKTFGKSYL